MSINYKQLEIDITAISRRAYSHLCAAVDNSGGLDIFSTSVPQAVPDNKYKLPFNKNRKLVKHSNNGSVDFMEADYFILFNLFTRLYAIALKKAKNRKVEIIFCMESFDNMYFVLDKELYDEFTPVWNT